MHAAALCVLGAGRPARTTTCAKTGNALLPPLVSAAASLPPVTPASCEAAVILFPAGAVGRRVSCPFVIDSKTQSQLRAYAHWSRPQCNNRSLRLVLRVGVRKRGEKGPKSVEIWASFAW